MVGPAGTPGAVINRLHREFTTILTDPSTRGRLAADAAETLIVTPAEFRNFIRDDIKKWREVAKRANIRVQ